ncbi:LytR/AlgR family response regulator transcription factor [Robertmurraya korlensis]|uniref:LytR/AlgR family response regulator transcription factor n=1 Tax=Robertmurraya korlensis TaxID=519977 RepID=UPI000825CAAF|nr:LytTR family DNA-binding domain-containing protein [Robertmurraya korlensis]
MDPFIKVMVVDDEPYSREELKHLLQSFATIQVVGEAESGEAALMKVLQLQPDVIFLDVEMPRMNGMELAKALKEFKKPPYIVFATAYPEFAAEAFRYDALDYLLKPFDEEQLQETIRRLEKKFTPKEETTRTTGKLAIEADGEILFIDPKEVYYIVRDEKNTKLVTEDHELITKLPLKEFESRLVSFGFFRIHKSFLVNLTYVKRLTPWFNGAYQLELQGKKELLSVSRNYVKALRSKLEI